IAHLLLRLRRRRRALLTTVALLVVLLLPAIVSRRCTRGSVSPVLHWLAPLSAISGDRLAYDARIGPRVRLDALSTLALCRFFRLPLFFLFVATAAIAGLSAAIKRRATLSIANLVPRIGRIGPVLGR